MKLEQVKELVAGVPYMGGKEAARLTNFIHEHQLRSILELGFAHGVSTCYMAGALQELGGGSIVTIDRESSRTLSPALPELLKRGGLEQLVTYYFEPTSYTWRLMKMIEDDPTPRFDFCYIDGAHSWAVDGLAFFLVDRLLKPGGWIIFDDLEWTYATSSLRNADFVKAMSREEQTVPQIRKVYELLVKQHPSYDEFAVIGDWAYARKVRHTAAGPVQTRRETIFVPRLRSPLARRALSLIRRKLERL